MKRIILILFVIPFLLSCSDKSLCKNKIYLIENNDSIPILTLDFLKSSVQLRNEINSLFSEDLCKRCSLVNFKIPFHINDKDIFIKVMTDFGSPVCEDCPVPTRLREYYSIVINKNNQLLVEDENTEINDLEANISKYLSKIGNDDLAPVTIKNLIFRVDWDQKSSSDFINKVLNILFKSYTEYIENKTIILGKYYCDLEKNEILELKENFPLRVELDLGKQEKYFEIITQNFENRNCEMKR